MNYVTTDDRVIVKPDEPNKKTSSGLVLAYSDETTRLGTVMQVGPGRTTKKKVVIPVDLASEDRVMFPIGAGIPVKLNGEDYLILKEDEIIGIVE